MKHGFSQRRKQLRNLLAADVGNWEDIASKIRAPLTARAEELSREQWIELANLIALDDVKSAAQAGPERFPIVDENDREIGSASRQEVHENNFRHRAVHILIFNGTGNYFYKSVPHGKTDIPCSGIRAQPVTWKLTNNAMKPRTAN